MRSRLKESAMQLPQDTIDELGGRLRKVGGQLRGIETMLADQRDCREIATQISAANKALEQVGFLLIAAGFRWCVEHPSESAADGYSLDDVQNLFLKLA
jgi:DNA-binding FrmR family transcriptional regulator